MPKVVERLICRQLMAILDRHRLLPDLQSAYMAHCSTETAVLKIVSDILSAADSGKVTLLDLMLDMSAAFCTVNHSTLIEHLNTSFGIGDAVLSWILSFITGWTQAVQVGDDKSAISSVLCGVLQSYCTRLTYSTLFRDMDWSATLTRMTRRFTSTWILPRVVPSYQSSLRVSITLVPGCSPTVSRLT